MKPKISKQEIWTKGMRTFAASLFLLNGSAVFAQSQITPNSSMFMPLGNRQAVQVPFAIKSAGKPTLIRWGMDTAWDDEGNVKRGVNFIGRSYLTTGRISFQLMDAVNADGTLSSRMTTALQNRINHIKLTSPQGVLLNADPVDINTSLYTNKPEAWYKVIKATVVYARNHGITIESIAPFNEPDITENHEGTQASMKAVAKLLSEDPDLKGVRIVAGNTCNNDQALSWYNAVKPYVTEGNTHQLAGSFDTYAGFYQTVKADGNVATNDELHNVMEGIVGAEYGLQNGIWWGAAGPTRGDFCQATSEGGARLAYAENRDAWSGAAVYRLPDGRVDAFAGVSERQASSCSYQYVSTDKAVYYDGYGPFRVFNLDMPGGYGYQDAYQRNAERKIHIQQGEDVPVCPIVDGDYIIMNKKSQKILSILGASTANSAQIVQSSYANKDYQQWTIKALPSTVGGDFYGFYISSKRNGKMRMETGGFQVDPGNNTTVNVYPETVQDNQKWVFEYAGNGCYRMRNFQSGLYVGAQDGNTGNNIMMRLSATANDDSQLWKILPVDAACELTAPAVPSGVKATAQLASVKIEWNQNVTDADINGYEVLRGTRNSQGGIDYEVIGRDIKQTSFVDNSCNPLTTYSYAVRAVDYSQNRSAKSAAVQASTKNANGLVARYEFDNSSNDNTENLMNGVIANADGYVQGLDTHRSGLAALNLDGSENYMRLPSEVAWQKNMTVAAWVCNDSQPAQGSHLFDFGTHADECMYLALNTNKQMQFVMKHNGTEQVVTAPELGTGWHHVAVAVGEKNIVLYVDGKSVATSSDVKIRPSDIQPVMNYIGAAQQNTVPLMKGIVDDLRLYNYSLGEGEIADLIKNVKAEEPASGYWLQPVVPGKNLADVKSTESIYVYNVDADAFITFGMDWGTNGIATRLFTGDTRLDGAFNTTVDVSGSKVYVGLRSKSGKYIACMDGSNNAWVDRSKSEGAFTYTLTGSSQTGNIYTLKSDTQNGLLDVSYSYGGHLTTRNGKGYTRWTFIPTSEITNGSYARYKERKDLYALYREVVAAGAETKYASALKTANTVYNDEAASVAELRAATRQLILDVAPALSDVKVSALFKNADMLGNGTAADWTKTSVTISSADIEKYHEKLKFSQTQTDLPNGTYKVVLHAFYRNDGSDAAPVFSVEGASKKSASVPLLSTIKSKESTLVAEDNMRGAGQVFTSDQSVAVISDVLVNDHAMTISVDVNSANQWMNIQSIDIIYQRPFAQVEVPAYGYTTYYDSKQSYILPEGMEAFTLQQEFNDIVMGHQYKSGDVIPAGYGVVIKAAPGEYTMEPTDKYGYTDPFSNIKGSDVDEMTKGSNYYYTLTNGENGVAVSWKNANGTAFLNKAHHAYFYMDQTEGLKSTYLLDAITAIEQVLGAPQQSGKTYNLRGQRVGNDYPSVIIRNGKVIVPARH